MIGVEVKERCKMDSHTDRRSGGRKEMRIKVVLDDQVNMNMAATVDFSEDGLLLASGVSLEPGTTVAIFPLLDEMDAQLFELKGEVVRTYEDIMVSAYSEDRFCMGVALTLTELQKAALRRFVENPN